MQTSHQTKIASLAVAFLAACVTLVISPGYSYDAFTVFKLIFLYALGGTSLLIISQNFSTFRSKLGLTAIVLIVLLLLNSILILFFSQVNFSETFYGRSGRYTGFGTFIALIATFTAASLLSNALTRRILLSSFIFTGSISAFYSVIQFTDNDFFTWDKVVEVNVVSFLGNPNFASSFLAVSATATFAQIIKTGVTLKIRLMYFVLLSATLIGIVGAKSTQGYLIIILGFGIVSFDYLRHKFDSKKFNTLAFGSFLLGGIVVLADILQKTPWKPILYSETVTLRGDYWRAAWNMALDFPLFGVGFNGFQNFYRRSRDSVAYNRIGSDVPVDSAHNIVLDYASNGGFIFMGLNILLVIVVFVSAAKYLRRLPEYEPSFISIFATWLGLTVQSLISPNQLGLTIWTWVFGGLILGVKNEIKTSPTNAISQKSKSYRKSKNGVYYFCLVAVSLGGALAASPIVTSDHSFKLAVDSGKAADLLSSAKAGPTNTARMVTVSAALTRYKLFQQARDLSKHALILNPDSFEAWRIYAANPLLSDEERSNVKKELIRLDPNIEKFEGIEKYLLVGKQ